MKPDPSVLRRFVTGALFDFLGYLSELSDPIIVGGHYSKDDLIRAFLTWRKNAISIRRMPTALAGSLPAD